MLKRNLKIAFRALRKNKLTSFIHILGLAVGISAALVIFMIVRYDYSFDKWEPESSQIYRVITDYGNYVFSGVSLKAPAQISDRVTGIKTLAEIREGNLLGYAQTTNKSEATYINSWGRLGFVDPNFFELFPHKWLSGTPSVLNELNTIVLSKSEVKRFFPDKSYSDVLGKVIYFNDSIGVTIRGIVADLKQLTDFDFKNFISISTFKAQSLFDYQSEDNWLSVNDRYQCLIKLEQTAKVEAVDHQIKTLYHQNFKDLAPDIKCVGQLQPLSHVHFNGETHGVVEKSSLVKLSVLAVILLLLAIINYVNLSTAQSVHRAKEVGIRKTFGSSKGMIISQFLMESFLLALVATILAVVLTPFILRAFNDYLPKGFDVHALYQPLVLGFLSGLVLLVSLMAGFYPAFVMTRFKPVAVLKGQALIKGRVQIGGSTFRKGLTVTQFVIAQVFLVLMVVVGKQVHFMLAKDLGYKEAGIVTVALPKQSNDHSRKNEMLQQEVQDMPGVQLASLSSKAPIFAWTNSGDYTVATQNGPKELKGVFEPLVDTNYVSLYGIKLIAGRNVAVHSGTSVTDALVNQRFLKKIGKDDPAQAIGKYIVSGSRDSSRIVGVVKDFANQSLHKGLMPAVLIGDNKRRATTLSVAFVGSDASEWKRSLSQIEGIFKEAYPKEVFKYNFYDESIRKLYTFDLRVSTLLTWATGLAIFISCLGLLGLVSFMANQRTKEIGIRKVLGASVGSIIGLLSKSLIKLVLLAAVIAFPFAWYFSNKWLRDFAFRISIGWSVFLICAVGMLMIALIVLCLRTLKAARANPVESLKDE